MIVAETDRMFIRHFTLDDVPPLAAFLADPEVMRFSVGGVLTENDACRFVEWCIGLYRRSGFGPWALVAKSSGALLGFCGLVPEAVDGVEEVHVGYRLGRQHWGRGFATEAVSRVLSYAFAQLGLSSMVAIIEPDHVASVRVAEKAGFGRFELKDVHGRTIRLYRKQSPATAQEP